MELKEINIKVQYYAIFREQANKSFEIRKTFSANPEELYYELKQEYAFTLPIELVKVAVNNKFVSFTHILTENDEILFIAPVAGG